MYICIEYAITYICIEYAITYICIEYTITYICIEYAITYICIEYASTYICIEYAITYIYIEDAVWMWWLVAFGEGGSNAPILMSGFLTLMRPRTVPTHLLPATPTMRGKNAVPMSSASGKWNTPALFPLFSPLREVWGNLRHLCSRGSPCS